jgi:hypothetical protein
LHHTLVPQPSRADFDKYFELLEACTPPKSPGKLLDAGYTPAAHKKLSKKVDTYGRTNARVKTAIAKYRRLVKKADKKVICGHVDTYLDERAAILLPAFKKHAKLHVSVNFKTCCGGNKAMRGENCTQCLFEDVGSIFEVVMKHNESDAVEDATVGVAGQLDIEHLVDLAGSVNTLLTSVCRIFATSPPLNYQDFRNGTSEVTIDGFLNHVHRSGPSAMCGPGHVSTFTCKKCHSGLESVGPGARMLQYNIETTLQFPESTSGLLVELKRENKVLTEQWDAMLAAIAAVPTYGFVLSLDEAKAKNAAAQVLVAPEPQLGGFHLPVAEVNFLSLDHSDYRHIKNNPGEVVALIKTMLDLAAKGNEVDWRKNRSIYMPGSVGPDQANNTTKSVTFKTLLATHLGERISAFRENI